MTRARRRKSQVTQNLGGGRSAICLVIEVFDTVPGEPRRQEAAADDENGRGQAIVKALSEGQWGHPSLP